MINLYCRASQSKFHPPSHLLARRLVPRSSVYLVSSPPSSPYSPECVEGNSLLKNSLCARFDPRSGTKDAVFGALWSFWSPIRGYFRLGAQFFNRLGRSANFRITSALRSSRKFVMTGL